MESCDLIYHYSGNIRNTGVRGAERQALAGYVGISTATTRAQGLVTSS